MLFCKRSMSGGRKTELNYFSMNPDINTIGKNIFSNNASYFNNSTISYFKFMENNCSRSNPNIISN
jgi:hypothetical protein